MDNALKERSISTGQYFVDHECTVREAAEALGVSKSTVHKDITERLPKASPLLYAEARKVLDFNKATRHIRGGQATKEKYRKLKKKS